MASPSSVCRRDAPADEDRETDAGRLPLGQGLRGAGVGHPLGGGGGVLVGLALELGGGAGGLGVALGEDDVLGLAGQQADELVALDRLALEQDLGEQLQGVAVLGEDVAGALVGLLDDPADLGVDRARQVVGVVGLGVHVAPEE